MRARWPMLLAVLLLCAATQARAAALDLAWLRAGQVEAVRLGHDGGAVVAAGDAVPLGSVWKLLVYAYAVDSGVATPDYRCGGALPEEIYCCAPGAGVGRDAALAQSCGLFFAPARLRLDAAAWRVYWRRRLGRDTTGPFDWLADPARLAPGLPVRLDTLLQVLASVPPGPRAQAEAALLRVVLDGRGAGTVRWLGTRLRVKTFSWHRPGRTQARLGGAAGWLDDGTPVWFAGDGTSAEVLQRWAPRLAAALPAPQAEPDGGCVVVDFFSRYPVRAVRGEGGVAVAGPLVGRYVVEFENGQRLALRSAGELVLATGAGRPRVQGRFSVNEYVARVLDREGDASEPEAAKALAVAARTYLQRHARWAASCQQIADSSARQRVSPTPASVAARGAARWTDGLVLDGADVRYHSDRPAPGVLAWTDAVAQARSGRWFDAILAHAYPGAVLSTGAGGQPCERLQRNEAWLARLVPRWERALAAQPGYERPATLPLVCALGGGAPFSEQSRNRIFMRPLSGREDRITLAHEYLHVALRNHPRGQDEGFVERLARALPDSTLESL